MIHYSAGVAASRTLSVPVSDLWDPVLRRDLRVALYKAMEADYSRVSGVSLTSSERRVIDNFNGWIDKCQSEFKADHWIETPIFCYVNLSTGTHIAFLMRETAVNCNYRYGFGDDLHRFLISLS